ncbi:MAG TPA: hybrid sensor histidine kinase/response regulator [Labilithrix sp.]|nr:hybrid sensor histidine kinase/response regulator [Labilithrix sp.]
MSTNDVATGSSPNLSEAATQNWNVLIVDDEKDVHEVTSLALRRRTWRKRRFNLTSCYSAKEAMDLLARSDETFQVALIDVVMETQTAGLDLCRHIRQQLPSSLRLVLRTGQPGAAPEEAVINDYDIDYYLAKPEVTPDKLFSVIRSCLRSSQDIDTLLAFSRQLRSFTAALQTITTDEDLVVFMKEGLKFLELKHQVRIHFVKNVDVLDPNDDQGEEDKTYRAAILEGHRRSLPLGKILSASALGLEEGDGLLFSVAVEGTEHVVRGGFLVETTRKGLMGGSLEGDLSLFMQNWTIAYGALLLQQRVARDKMLNERMYVERIESIANMVTGVAHEINTPLGIATTANGMLVSLAEQIIQTPKGTDLDELVADLRESTKLLSNNLERASRLVRSFKELSASQLSDERSTCDMAAVINDCLEAMKIETSRRDISIATSWGPNDTFPWIGFAGHLSQVIINLIQNVLRYAYKAGSAGKVDIRLSGVRNEYVLEFEDYGAGVPAAIYPRMFEPFVTSARGQGGTGLGLAISHNIVTNLLQGQIAATTREGAGTKFVIRVPKEVDA